jgi:hypothetical protein
MACSEDSTIAASLGRAGFAGQALTCRDQILLGLAALRDFALQIRIRTSEYRRTRNRQGSGHQPDQQNCGWHRCECGDRLDPAAQPVVRLPDHPDLHRMGHSACDDENRETYEDPMKREIAPSSDKIEQGDRDRCIGEGCERIRYDMQKKQVGAPQVTHAVGHEAILGERG